MTDPLVSVRDVRIRYDNTSAHLPDGVSFHLSRGDIVLLLGPSGSGKSTLILALNGLIPQAVPAELEGQVTVSGRDTASHTVPELSTHVAMVFQDPDAQMVTGTVFDEVAFGPENLRCSLEEINHRVEDALRRVGLWDRRGDNPDTLSGGGRQRLAIAAALAMGAPVLVLDEPTANLDPAGVEDVYATLTDIVADGDRTVVLVEHNLDAAMDLVTRVIVLNHAGHVIADGTSDTVLRDRAAELNRLGVWLPTATAAALRLHAFGYPLDPLPLTPAELTRQLQQLPLQEKRFTPHTATPATPATTEHAPPVQVKNLSITRGGTEIVHDVSFDIHAGQFCAIVGANGAGKTTLLQSIAGVSQPPRGTIFINGTDLSRMKAKDIPRQIGFVFQNPEHQFIRNTVYDELSYSLRGSDISDSHRRERVMDVLDRFGLADKKDVHPFLLSGGQKRRLSVATALVADAAILALDEPTFGQDRARADELLTLLAQLRVEGTTVIVITHDMQLVSEYADQVMIMGQGTVRGNGLSADILRDDALLRANGLRVPPLVDIFRTAPDTSGLRGITRFAQIPDLTGARPRG